METNRRIYFNYRGKRVLPILLVTNDHRFAGNVQAANPHVNILTLEQVADMKAIFQPAIPVLEMVCIAH